MKKTKWIWIWAAIGLVLGIIIFWPGNRGNKEAILDANAVEEVVDTTEQQQIHYKYGIPDENFIIEEGIVGKNENLSLILSKYKVRLKSMKSPNAARTSLTYEVSEEVKTTLFSWHKTAFAPRNFSFTKKMPWNTSLSTSKKRQMFTWAKKTS